MKSVIFLVSGDGGNLKFIYHAAKILDLEINIQMVIADRDCAAGKFSLQNGISSFKIRYSKEKPDELNSLLKEADSSLVVTNIHKILSPSTIALPHHFINLHYSILPSFKGLIGMETLEVAKKLNCPFIGSSSHIVTEEVDGGPIIQQGIFRVDWEKQNTDLQDTVFKVGNLVLLNTLLGGKGITQANRKQINDEQVDFSDQFSFDFMKLNTSRIWDLVK